MNGIGVDYSSRILKTTNGGESWVTTIVGSGDFHKVSFINNFTGFTIANGTNVVYKTTDFGLNWLATSILQDVQEQVVSIKFTSDSIGFIGGNFSRLYKTTNKGVNWYREQISTGFILDITSMNDSVLWTCGNEGRIFTTSTGGQPLVKIENTSNQIPDHFKLFQNYPNPFNNSTIIRFDIKQKGNYFLEIYNLKGQLIDNLINENLSPGSYKLRINLFDLPSGVYFYKLSSDKVVDTKKFILSK